MIFAPGKGASEPTFMLARVPVGPRYSLPGCLRGQDRLGQYAMSACLSIGKLPHASRQVVLAIHYIHSKRTKA